MEAKFPFNVRVYGILINERNELLVSDEFEHSTSFSKLPGGGLEYGEGPVEGLKREFMEECLAEVEVLEHFYTTDFFVRSAFDDSQVISIYYLVRLLKPLELSFKEHIFDFEGQTGEVMQSFRWIPLSRLTPDDMTYPIDRHVARLILENPGRLL